MPLRTWPPSYPSSLRMSTTIEKRLLRHVRSSASEAAWHYRPLRIAVGYLGSTFVAFLAVGQAGRVPDLTYLTVFVFLTLVVFTAGYAVQVSYGSPAEVAPAHHSKAPTLLITLCATYFLALGLANLSVSGVTSPAGVLHALTSPGSSYFDRLHAEPPSSSAAVQLLTLAAGLYPLLVPLAVFHWSRIGVALRVYIVAGLATYIAYFLSIGTLKGLGDVLIFWAASYSAKRCANRIRGTTQAKTRPRKQKLAVAAVVAIFLGYMAFAQSDRLNEGGQQALFPPNPVVAAVVGDDLASGLSVSLYYPTHGYLGLGYNLESPFVWTYGVGGSVAIGRYWQKFTGADSEIGNRYTARTERLSGWPDGMYWSTIYPWLASDLTFPGAVLFMGIVGWFLAKFWREAVLQQRTLSLALLCQLTLAIAFVPANNQIGQSSPALIAFVTTAAMSLWQRIRAVIRDRPEPSDGGDI
jgi:hypothetical protein